MSHPDTCQNSSVYYVEKLSELRRPLLQATVRSCPRPRADSVAGGALRWARAALELKRELACLTQAVRCAAKLRPALHSDQQDELHAQRPSAASQTSTRTTTLRCRFVNSRVFSCVINPLTAGGACRYSAASRAQRFPLLCGLPKPTEIPHLVFSFRCTFESFPI